MIITVKNIFLCSLKEKVGKSFLSIGIMLKLQKAELKIAYFKPIGIPKATFSNKVDLDVGFIINSILKNKLPHDTISPVSIPKDYYIDLINAEKKQANLNKIKQAYNELAKYYDYIIIEGCPSIKKFIRVGLDDITIAKALDINDLVFIETESSDYCLDNLFFVKKYFKFRNINMKGIIFNKIDYNYKARINELSENHILRYGIPILGIIEKNIELFSPRVHEIKEAIGGEVINRSQSPDLNNLVETYIIGAMNTQDALKYLRQVKKAAIITGGDRTDLILVALKEDVSVIILTGFIQPDISVITAANEKGIPIILSPSDTYTTLRNMERIKPGIQEDETHLVLDLIEKEVDWYLLLK